jgi:hypothetical protein
VKSTAPFSSRATQPPWPSGSPHEIGLEGGRGSKGEQARLRRGIGGAAAASERDVCPPFASGGNASHRADNLACRDQDAQVVALRLDELLHERPLASKPGLAAEVAKAAFERGAAPAHADVATPAPEARLHHHGELERQVAGRADVSGAGVRKPARGEPERGHELVVRSEEHRRD